MNIEKAMKKARNVIESRYEDTCNIIELQNIYNEKSKQTVPTEVIVYENKPCQLSYKTISYNEETDTGAKKIQIVELFISPDIKINPGSKIVGTHKGIETSYKNSGEPSIYNTQQTIVLELFEKWS
jgi:hypothetical protein